MLTLSFLLPTDDVRLDTELPQIFSDNGGRSNTWNLFSCESRGIISFFCFCVTLAAGLPLYRVLCCTQRLLGLFGRDTRGGTMLKGPLTRETPTNGPRDLASSAIGPPRVWSIWDLPVFIRPGSVLSPLPWSPARPVTQVHDLRFRVHQSTGRSAW
jgi:hypothetical protein